MGAEEHLPYDRPPLSKTMLSTEQDPGELSLISDSDLAELNLNLVLGSPATRLDTVTHEVTVGDERIFYDGLIIATGARARKLLKSDDIGGIHTLRTMEDSLAIRSALESSSSVVIVGAGFIGSEVAAAARHRGCQVSIIEAGEAPLMRGLGHEVGSACGQLHQSHGVDLRVGVQIQNFHGSQTVEEVELTDGSRIGADLVVVGVGATPNTEWLDDSGLTIDDGVVCDASLNVGMPGIYAAGDVARVPNHWMGGGPLRPSTGQRLLSMLRSPLRTCSNRPTALLMTRSLCLVGPIRGPHSNCMRHRRFRRRLFSNGLPRGRSFCSRL